MTDPTQPNDSVPSTTEPAQRPWTHWLIEGARTAVFMRPRTAGLQAGPMVVSVLLILLVLAGVALQRVTIDGPAVFYAEAIDSGWLLTLLMLGVVWTLVRARAANPPAANDGTIDSIGSTGTATLFALLLAQELTAVVLWGAAAVAAMRWAALLVPDYADALIWGLFAALLVWIGLATGLLLWRLAPKRLAPRALAVLATATAIALPWWAPGASYWYADRSAATGEANAPKPAVLQLSQALIESQILVLPEALNRLQAGRPGVVDLFAITFAPYAEEDVFSREAGMVSELMRTRFDAPQRTVQLQNHARTADSVPWATPVNLQRSIYRIAELMDRDEDVLFIHLTSHGGRDGKLAASFEPLAVDSVTPEQLKTWLDEAGVRYRVLSISACYSGSWIAPLSGAGTLVMTAADAEHTSYGCGRLSELTFFGRAMYDEQLRATHSFEAAHAAVRPVIEQREKDAGKDDGFSNPQIAVGADIRGPLRDLEQRLAAMPATPLR